MLLGTLILQYWQSYSIITRSSRVNTVSTSRARAKDGEIVPVRETNSYRGEKFSTN